MRKKPAEITFPFVYSKGSVSVKIYKTRGAEVMAGARCNSSPMIQTIMAPCAMSYGPFRGEKYLSKL